MGSFFRSPKPKAPVLERPRLELSGPILTAAMETLAVGCEPSGGVERYLDALTLRAQIIANVLTADAEGPGAEDMAAVAMLMPTVRRRIGPYLEGAPFIALRAAIAALINAPFDPVTVDDRIGEFCAALPHDKAHRWVRDLAAEILHAADVERFPLMCRWVWDEAANTGVLREIWHGDIDRETLRVADGYATFLMLREELTQFLSANGVFRNVLYFADLVCARVYADYISAQGGSYLRADFSSDEDPALHVRRLLGLDGVKTKTLRTRAGVEAGAAAALLDQR